MPRSTREVFWDRRIGPWERTRYDSVAGAGWREALAGRASAPVRRRLALAVAILSSHARGAHVLELGCGTGRLAGALLDAGAASYRGVDFSQAAIGAARERLAGHPRASERAFAVASVGEVDPADATLVISLGLLDWLDKDDVHRVADFSAGRGFLHSISERRHHPFQWLHRGYTAMAYGARNPYRPRYDAINDLPAPLCAARCVRERALGFATLLTNLENAP